MAKKPPKKTSARKEKEAEAPAASAPHPPPAPEKKGEVVRVVLGGEAPVTPKSLPAPAPPPPPPPPPALDQLPPGATGQRGHPNFGAEAYILRLQKDLDNYEQTYYVHDDETIKSVTDPSLDEKDRLANVTRNARLRASGT